MPLITAKYFVGEINIVGWEDSQAVRERICSLIAIKEPEYLEQVLGYEFMQLFNNGITNNENRFTRIKNGDLFTLRTGRKQRFNGLAKGELFESPIANYIYYWFKRDSESSSTNTGEAQNNADNAKLVSGNAKACRAFNVSARAANDLWYILQNAIKDDGTLLYPEFDIQEAETKSFKTINVLGI